jgi:hypothetical protein
MYIYIYTYICIYTHIDIHIYIYIYIYTHTHTHTHIPARPYGAPRECPASGEVQTPDKKKIPYTSSLLAIH